MGKDSSIQWTHHTFNPWVGCQRVSPGCVNCYAEAYDKRVGGAKIMDTSAGVAMEYKTLRWGPMAPRTRTSESYWRKPLAWDRAAEAAGERHRVFCASLADVFEDRPELLRWRVDLFDLIRRTPNLDWLLLTKRPENILRLLTEARVLQTTATSLDTWLASWLLVGSSPHNVWLGTTVEDARRADERIPWLLKVPARVRFLSCEPLLERVNFNHSTVWNPAEHGMYLEGINWVIIGGESGPKARPFLIDWARDLVRQCRHAGAAPFVKQMGSNAGELTYDGMNVDDLDFKDSHGGDPSEWPVDLRVREFPTRHLP